MDIAALSTTLATMDIQTKVGTAMLDNALELGEVMSEGMVDMIDAAAMELSVNPNVGANVDVRI